MQRPGSRDTDGQPDAKMPSTHPAPGRVRGIPKGKLTQHQVSTREDKTLTNGLFRCETDLVLYHWYVLFDSTSNFVTFDAKISAIS